MLFHQMQLMVCAVIAKRRSHDAERPEPGVEPAGASRTAVGTGTRTD
jgi:sodium/bile acid cotransporter 7